MGEDLVDRPVIVDVRAVVRGEQLAIAADQAVGGQAEATARGAQRRRRAAS